MPPAKVQVTCRFDRDVAEYIEETYHRKLVDKAFEQRDKIPSKTEAYNIALREFIDAVKARKI
ncbi:MAG: hypothetical protein HYU02_01060 [Thaumarchaeota archaeon]|nr:hypothetical protein [Nitrososphaerota archaeon]